MSRTLVLVRHGDALGREPGQTDAQRSLSDAGMRALEEAFPRTFGLLEPAKSSELWVSTALRARQTAKIANETLGIESVYELKCLYDQDGDAFMRELSQTNADVVVVVGHIPFMEDACALLCGQYLGFSTGAAAAISLNDRDVRQLANGRVRGRLLWFVQGSLD